MSSFNKDSLHAYLGQELNKADVIIESLTKRGDNENACLLTEAADLIRRLMDDAAPAAPAHVPAPAEADEAALKFPFLNVFWGDICP